MSYESEKFFNGMKDRLTTGPLPTGTLAQRDLGDRELLFEFLVSSTHPNTSDMILGIIQQQAQQGNVQALDQLWLTQAFAHVAHAKIQGTPVTLLANTLNDEDAARILGNSIPILAMYARGADAGRFDEITANLRRIVSEAPSSLPPLTTDAEKFVPRDMSDPHGREIAFRILQVCDKVRQTLAMA